MKAILLAAGIGSRIARHISHEHKCLLPLSIGSQESTPLITYTVDSLFQYAVSDITVVTGYQHKEVEKSISQYKKVHCVFNPFYYLVNSIGSLWFAKDIFLQEVDDIIIMNADTFLNKSIFRLVCDSIQKIDSPILLVDSHRKDLADVKVTYNKQNILELYGKEIDIPPMAESVDIVLIPKSFVSIFYTQLLEMLEQRHHDTWWESVLVEQKKYSVSIIDIAGTFWSEIDFIEDYQRICDYVRG